MSSAIAGDALVLDMRIHVGADGHVIEVVPDESVPVELRELLVSRVSQWQFSVPVWQGHAVSLWKPYTLWLEPVPTTSGGYALRVAPPGVREPGRDDARPVPVYPESLMRRRVGGNFVYLVRAAADGTLLDVRRRYPEGELDRDQRRLDESSIAAIRASEWPAPIVDGAPVGCTRLYPIVFTIDAEAPPVQQLVEPLRSGVDDLCPQTQLESEVVGTLF